jgi:hypothetical protein
MRSRTSLIGVVLLAAALALFAAGTSAADCVCEGRTGNADDQGTYPNEIDSGDLGAIIALLFNPPGSVTIPCLPEADVNADGEFTSSDMGDMVYFLYSPRGTVTLPDCP